MDEDRVRALEDELRDLAAAEADLERDAEVAERTRIERSALTLADRLRGAHGPVEIATRGGGRHAGRVQEVGDGWAVVEHVPPGSRVVAAEHLVVLAAAVAVRGLGRPLVRDEGRLPERTLGSVLRAWCRDRSHVSVLLVEGDVVAGLASAAYADHLELSTGGGATVALPYAAIAVVSR
ncbi:MAG: hypothetical protein U0R76_09665 [Candidatus Nanopelagicales bacterium]